MAGPVAPLPCPICGGPMWDNSNDPKKKPGQSDYRCKDRKNCNGGIWLKPEERAALAKAAPPQAQSSAAPAGPRRKPLVLEKVMALALDLAIEITQAKMIDGDVKGADHDITLRMAQSLFIARIDGKGIFEVEKVALEKAAKAAAEKAAEAARVAAEVAARAAAKAAEDRARQASESQVGAGASGSYAGQFDDFPQALEDQDDDLPF